MLSAPQKAYLLFGGAEPWADGSGPDAVRTLGGASFVVAATPFADETLKSVAHVLLPISTFAETSGTYVNLEGLWQSFTGAARPLGEVRPGWKVLRVLGNLAGVAEFRLPVFRGSARGTSLPLRRHCRHVLPGHTRGLTSKSAARGRQV